MDRQTLFQTVYNEMAIVTWRVKEKKCNYPRFEDVETDLQGDGEMVEGVNILHRR